MLLNKILIFLHRLLGTGYCTIDVTYGNVITKYKNVKNFELQPIHNGAWLSITDKDGFTVEYGLFNEVDKDWRIEIKR